MSSQQYDAGREGARRVHRIIALYAVIFCWKNDLDAVMIPKSTLCSILGINRIETAREEWLSDDVKSYFTFFFVGKKGDFFLSKVSQLELKNSRNFKEIKTEKIDYFIDFSVIIDSEKDIVAKEVIKNKFPFLIGNTSATSHLLSLLMLTLASGATDIEQIF
jgi:hypothetical protein